MGGRGATSGIQKNVRKVEGIRGSVFSAYSEVTKSSKNTIWIENTNRPHAVIRTDKGELHLYAKGCKDKAGKGVHFFIDDYQFNRLWNAPDRYIDMLSGFDCVMSPDFSTYTDFPKAIQIYNHYRKHWVGAYLQMHGIDVIPTISWSDKDSFEWCFDGEPVNSVVAVSSVGCMNSKKRKELFIDGYCAMMDRLKPTTIIFYGKVPEECEGNIIQIKVFQEKYREGK